jgi:ABC-type multidrug transport system fused ATPase/permease subunit
VGGLPTHQELALSTDEAVAAEETVADPGRDVVASEVAGPGVVRRGMRILGRAVLTEPKPFAIAVVGAAVYGGMTVASATVFGRVTDRVIVPAYAGGAVTRGTLALAVTAILGVALLKAVGIVARRIGATYMQVKLQASYRERVTRQYQKLPLSWHRRHSTGTLLAHANADVEAAFWPIAPFPFSCGVVLMLLITGVILVRSDLFLAAVGFLVGPAIAVLNWRYNRALEEPATLAQQRRADVSSVAHESFDGALVVKTLGRESAETDRFEVEARRLRDELVRYGRIRALFDPLMEALPNVGVLLILAVGVWRISTGDLSVGDLVQFAYLFTLLAFPIRAIGWVLSDMPRAVVGWERVQGVLAATGDLPYGSDRGLDAEGAAAADLVHVAFAYESSTDGQAGSPVLHDVTFEATPGRTIAIVGPTGAGKSTIASLLVRLADPTQGSVHLDGQDLRTLARGELSRSVAIVFQHSFLFDDTVRGNITLGERFSDKQVRAASELAQADGFIRALPDGYDTVVGERGTSLSGGQRQRIALARALTRRPRLLILDDATSSVDTTVEAAILHGLRDARLPATIAVVAYRQATILLADEIIFVDRGRVQATGTHERLLETVPGYARLVTAYADEAVRRERRRSDQAVQEAEAAS